VYPAAGEISVRKVGHPAAPSKWRLKYAHARRGFPRSSLRTELEDAWLGSTALSVHEKDGRRSWKRVYYMVNDALELVGEHASPTLIKKGVAKVRKARQLLKADSSSQRIIE
jgi:hypothetical protein